MMKQKKATLTNLGKANDQQRPPILAGNQPAFPPGFEPIDTIKSLPQEPFNARTHIVFMTIIEIPGKVFSNQLGRFPIMSNRGNKCVVIFYIYDANFVKSVPIKSRTKEELLQAYKLVYAYLTACCFDPQLHKMDNKTSHDVENFICKESTWLQYNPPYIHLTNSAEWKFGLGRITSSLASLGFQKPSLLQIGVDSLIKLTSPSTCSVHAIKIQLSWCSKHSNGPSSSMQHQWPP